METTTYTHKFKKHTDLDTLNNQGSHQGHGPLPKCFQPISRLSRVQGGTTVQLWR